MLDTAIHRMNHYLAEVLGKPITLYIQWIEIYPVDRIAWSSFEHLSPGLVLVNKATSSLATD